MRRLSAIAVMLTVVMLTISAPWPATAYTQADADACMPDAMRLCMEAMPDEGRVAQCLVRNKSQLSPACTAVFDREPTLNAARERPARVRATRF